jgi:PEP-CTERM motif
MRKQSRLRARTAPLALLVNREALAARPRPRPRQATRRTSPRRPGATAARVARAATITPLARAAPAARPVRRRLRRARMVQPPRRRPPPAGTAPRGSTASALSSAAVLTAAMGSVPESVVAILPGHAISYAALTPGGGLTIGVGAMSVGYGATSFGITYDATAVFGFTAPSTKEALDLSLLSYNFAASTGLGFDSGLLWVDVDGNVHSFSLASLSAAKTFFAPGHSLALGTISGKQSIEIEYSLTYNLGTAAAPGDGFGFTYALMDPPLSVPEPSTWTMMLGGFAGLAWVGHHARRRRFAKST